MEQIRLGRSELRVSRSAFGTWQLGGDWGATDETAAIAAIRHASDSGINFFDTAQGYGFGRPRDQVVIATKGGLRPTPVSGGVERDASPPGFDGAWRRVYALSGPSISTSTRFTGRTPFKETAAALADLRRAGKIPACRCLQLRRRADGCF